MVPFIQSDRSPDNADHHERQLNSLRDVAEAAFNVVRDRNSDIGSSVECDKGESRLCENPFIIGTSVAAYGESPLKFVFDFSVMSAIGPGMGEDSRPISGRTDFLTDRANEVDQEHVVEMLGIVRISSELMGMILGHDLDLDSARSTISKFYYIELDGSSKPFELKDVTSEDELEQYFLDWFNAMIEYSEASYPDLDLTEDAALGNLKKLVEEVSKGGESESQININLGETGVAFMADVVNFCETYLSNMSDIQKLVLSSLLRNVILGNDLGVISQAGLLARQHSAGISPDSEEGRNFYENYYRNVIGSSCRIILKRLSGGD